MPCRPRVFVLSVGLAVGAAAVLPPHRASANTCTSTGTGAWDTAATWSGCGGTVPQAGDDVVVAASHTVTVDVNTNAVASLSVSGTLTVGNSNAARTVTVTGIEQLCFCKIGEGGTSMAVSGLTKG